MAMTATYTSTVQGPAVQRRSRRRNARVALARWRPPGAL